MAAVSANALNHFVLASSGQRVPSQWTISTGTTTMQHNFNCLPGERTSFLVWFLAVVVLSRIVISSARCTTTVVQGYLHLWGRTGTTSTVRLWCTRVALLVPAAAPWYMHHHVYIMTQKLWRSIRISRIAEAGQATWLAGTESKWQRSIHLALPISPTRVINMAKTEN